MKKINILFVCRYNRLRSRIALAYFNKINKNKNIKAKSAGLIKGMPLKPETVDLIKKECKLNIRGNPQGLSSKLMFWQNFVVIVADNVPSIVFKSQKRYGKGLKVFKISDAKRETNKDKIEVAKNIIKVVDKLNQELNNTR